MKHSKLDTRKTKIIQVISNIFWTNITSKIFTCLSVIASVTGFTLKDLMSDEYKNYIPDTKYILAAIVIAIFARMFWLLVHNTPEPKAVTKREPSASTLMGHVKDLVFILNTLPNGSEEKGVVLAELCNKLRDCMDWITGSSCCVSIKLITGHEDGNFNMPPSELPKCNVCNVARDCNHLSRDSKDYKNIEHIIASNTAYSTVVGKLYANEQAFYRNNDVNADTDYMTTSPYKKHEVPYKSELVYGIVKKYSKSQVAFKGFLCIDSNKRNAFRNDKLILNLAAAIADSLFWILTFSDEK
jgi:hypothetical protein